MRPKEHCFKRLVDKWKLCLLSKKYNWKIKDDGLICYHANLKNEDVAELEFFLNSVNLVIKHHYFYCYYWNKTDYFYIGVNRFSLYPVSEKLTTLYHSTNIKNVDSIMQTGLIPCSRFTELKGCFPLIFTSNNKCNWIHDGVLLKINASNYHWYKDTNLFKCDWSFCTDQLIKSEDIKIVK